MDEGDSRAAGKIAAGREGGFYGSVIAWEEGQSFKLNVHR